MNRNKANAKEGYYEINSDIEQSIFENATLEDVFYLKDLKQRKLFLNMDIDQLSVFPIVRNILQYNAEDKDTPIEERKPILLYITSNGGEVDAGFELIDIIRNSKTPVYTVNLGYQYSMGFLIGLAGHKRFATQNAKFLMHDGSNFTYNSAAKLQDEMEFYKKVNDRVKSYVISRSKVTQEEYDSKFRVEWYLFASEAKEKGFVDYILGEDCSIDEIA